MKERQEEGLRSLKVQWVYQPFLGNGGCLLSLKQPARLLPDPLSISPFSIFAYLRGIFSSTASSLSKFLVLHLWNSAQLSAIPAPLFHLLCCPPCCCFLFMCTCRIAQSNCSVRSAARTVRMELIGAHCTDARLLGLWLRTPPGRDVCVLLVLRVVN
jgi:hypothetical protein